MNSEKQPSVAIIGQVQVDSFQHSCKVWVVTVFERSKSGRQNSLREGRFQYDLALHSSTTQGIEDIFQAIGLDAHEELKLKKADINYRLIFGQGGILDCTSNVDQMVERIAELLEKERPLQNT